MTRATTCRLVLLLAAIAVGGCCDGPKHRTPWRNQYVIKAQGAQVGRSAMYFSIEDDKAVSGFETYCPRDSNEWGPIRQPRRVFTRCVETLDGRPLSFHQEVTAHDGKVETLDYTVGADGKVTLSRTSGTPGNMTTRMGSATWPKDGLMWHGEYLLAKKNGLKEGTTYKFKRFNGWSVRSNEVKFRVGRTRMVDMKGRQMMLTEIIQVQRDPSGSRPTGVSIRYVDEDFVTHKTRNTWGDSETTWVAVSDEEDEKKDKPKP